MTIAKSINKTLDISVEDVRIDLTATIKSYDLTDTQFIFEIKSSNGMTVNLTGSAATYVVEYVHNSQTYAIQGDVNIIGTDTLSFNLPEDLKGYSGTVLIGIYVKLTDGTKIDIKDIAVRIEPSIMDKDIDFSAKTYFKDFESIKAEVILEGEKAKTEIKAIVSDVQSTGDAAKADIKATLPSVQAQVSELKEDLVNIEDSFIANLADSSKFTDGHCTKSGQIVSPSGDYFYTGKISVKSGETIYFNGAKIRFLTAYKNGVVSESDGLDVTDIGYYLVPDGVTEIVITSSPQFLNNTKDLMINKGNKLYDYIPYGTLILKSDKLQKANEKKYNSVFSENLANGTNLECETNNIAKNKSLTLYANVSNFDSIVIGHGFLSYDGSALLIDNTNVQVVKYSPSAEIIKTVAHGLTISDFISVSISVDNQRKANILITTKSGGFTLNDVSWGGCSGKPFVRPRNCNLTNCKLTFACADYSKQIWAFGDSYMTTTAPTRYPYYLYELGIDNYLLDAFGGRNSKQALESLNNALKYGKPRYLLWFLGMNDPDTNSTSNADWYTVYNEVIDICKAKAITPIFARIPCTPTNNNWYKNSVIEKSGYRFVNFARAVGANDIGSSWYDGLLSNDKIHPTEEGAKVLANQLLVDVPELTI